MVFNGNWDKILSVPWSISSSCHPFWDHCPEDRTIGILHSSCGRTHPWDRKWSKSSCTSSCADCCVKCRKEVELTGPKCRPFLHCETFASSVSHAWETWTRGDEYYKEKNIYYICYDNLRTVSYLFFGHFRVSLLISGREMNVKCISA